MAVFRHRQTFQLLIFSSRKLIRQKSNCEQVSFLKCQPLKKLAFLSINDHYKFSTTTPPKSQSIGACWKCGEQLGPASKENKLSVEHLLLCYKCGCPQPLSLSLSGGVTYFQLLETPETYQVDVEGLGRTTRKLQRKLHPDLFAQKSQKAEELSQELSSLINKAFSTLCDPIERGRYLLHLRGVTDPLGDIEKEVTSDEGFLEEVMDLNERLQELDSEQDWRDFRTTNETSLNQLQKDLGDAFGRGDIEGAKVILGRMKYYHTLQGKLKELKSKLNIVE